jgi:hypothetical protein
MNRAFRLKVLAVLASFAFAAGADAARIVVRAAPPVPRREVIAKRPGPNHVWVAGHWRWVGRRYAWVAGGWQLPPRPRAVWIPGRYRKVRGGYVWVEGRWR